MNDFDFSNQIVIVTGGAGGIGAATLAAFVERGAIGWSIDRVEADVRGVKSRVVDVKDRAATESAIDAIAKESGGLDALVVCAGITRDKVLWKLTDEDWQSVLDVNLTGAFHALRAAAPHLRARGKGAVVLVASIIGERGNLGQGNYAASKAGMIGLGKSAARELGRFGVRVNMICPGYIDSAMTRALPAGVFEAAREEQVLVRTGEPRDVAHPILFLCSDLARHVTGQVLRVDGGHVI